MKEEDVGVPNPRDGAQVWGIHKVDVILGLQEVVAHLDDLLVGNGFSAPQDVVPDVFLHPVGELVLAPLRDPPEVWGQDASQLPALASRP